MVNKKSFLTLLGVLFLTQPWLQASQMPDKPSGQQNDTKRALTISDDKNFSGINFTDKALPEDISYANLTNANLAGHHFRDTNFTGTQLRGVVLTNTTCNYLQCFQDNVSTNKLFVDKFYLDHLPKDLKSIMEIYPSLSQDSHKAKLLQIACGLAYLPSYTKKEFHIKVEYWSCKLLMLKKQLGNIGAQLACSLASELENEAIDFCWQTDYPYHLEHPKGIQIARQWCLIATRQPLANELSKYIQYYITERQQKLHANFDQYLKLFQAGLVKYRVSSKKILGYNSYKDTIEKNIQGLKKVYPQLTSPKLQKEAIDIAHKLSQQYKKRHLLFLWHYLSYQNRLLELKQSSGIGCENDMYFDCKNKWALDVFSRAAGKDVIYYNPSWCSTTNT